MIMSTTKTIQNLMFIIKSDIKLKCHTATAVKINKYKQIFKTILMEIYKNNIDCHE